MQNIQAIIKTLTCQILLVSLCFFSTADCSSDQPPSDLSGQKKYSESELTTQVCLKQTGNPNAQTGSNNSEILARFANIEWLFQDRVSTTTSDALGGYEVCDLFPETAKVDTYVRAQSPFPAGNNLFTKYTKISFTTGKKEEALKVGAPDIIETLFTEGDLLFLSLNKNELPLIAKDRIVFDENSQKFYYDSSLSPIFDEEGGRKFKATEQIASPDFGEGQGVVVIQSFELNFDYESMGGDLLSVLYPQSSMSALTSQQDDILDFIEPYLDDVDSKFDQMFPQVLGDPVFFGLFEGGGAYGNVRLLIADHVSTMNQFNQDESFCSHVGINRIGDKVISDLEQGFLNAIDTIGGVAAGLIPGPFLSGSNNQAEHFDTDSFSDKLNDGGRGKTYYKNLPAVDCDQFGNRKASILLIESDEDVYNDIIGCWEEVEFTPCQDHTATLTLSNEQFIENRKIRDLVISDPDLNYTAKIKLGFQSSLSQ